MFKPQNERDSGPLFIRFFERFAEWFGLVELKFLSKDRYFDRKVKVIKTKLLDNLIMI